jgi:hypothetical protein
MEGDRVVNRKPMLTRGEGGASLESFKFFNHKIKLSYV